MGGSRDGGAIPDLTYGKIFQSMFTGSMAGAGANVFAVMSYVISFMQPDKERVEHVRLQVSYLALVIGEDEKVIQKAIEFLCEKDPKSNSPEDGGRRLVPEGGFNFRVVNGRYYRELKDEDDRRRKDAERSARYRDRKALKKANGAVVPDHRTAERLSETHGQEAAERLVEQQEVERREIARERAEFDAPDGKLPPAKEDGPPIQTSADVRNLDSEPVPAESDVEGDEDL